MKTKSTANHQIDALKKDYEGGKLKANLEYQRYNNAWGPQQKGSLIVSILQNYPIGEIIRNKVNSPNGVSEEFEIVDGYQRLTAISEFMNDQFALNPENSKKIIESYLPHFKLSNSKISLGILKNFESNENVRLKFKSLPKTIQDKISETEVSVATLSNWDIKEVIEYFRRVQEGKPLTNADKLHTIQTELTSNLKKLSSNENILNCLGLNLENGRKRKGSDRIVYQTSLEAIYCKMGQSIGQPSKLDNFFKDKEYSTEQENYYNLINNFLSNLSTTDKQLLSQKSITTDLKLIFCLILFGDNTFKNYDIKNYKNYLIDLAIISGLLKTYNDGKTPENLANLQKRLNNSNLVDIYENNKVLFGQFFRLRWSSHSMKEVQIVCEQMSKLYKNTINQKLEVLV
jgi:hypothetical protein